MHRKLNKEEQQKQVLKLQFIPLNGEQKVARFRERANPYICVYM